MSPSRARRRVASKFAFGWERGREGLTASASERRLASHLLRRESMTLPSTVEERTTIYTHNTHSQNFQEHAAARPPRSDAASRKKQDDGGARQVTHPEFVAGKMGRRRQPGRPGRGSEPR